jgi:O-antigen/teichoic acid export membrane protein
MVADARERAGTGGGRRWGPAALWQLLWSKALRRLGWGIADQAVSTLTNFSVSVYIARSLGAVEFGAFSVAYVTYAFALNASRGLATSPLVIRFSGTDHKTWRPAASSCVSTATIVGLVAGICALGVTPFLSGPIRPAIFALGVTLPGLLLQDSWRFAFFALGRGDQAFLNDLVWGITLLPALVALGKTGHASVFWFVLAWGATGSVGAAIGPLQAKVIPRLSDGWTWLRTHRDLGPRYLAEGLWSAGGGQIRTYGIGLILSLTAVGYIQAASTEVGPVTVLYSAINLVAIPEAARVLRRSPGRLPLFCVLISAAAVGAALLWGIVLLVALPAGLGHLLLGQIWRPAYSLLVPQLLWVMATAAGLGAGAGIHALGGVRRALRVMMITVSLYVVATLLGAFAGGAMWALLAGAIAGWLAVPLIWQQLRAAKREYDYVMSGEQSAEYRRNGRHRKLLIVQIQGYDSGGAAGPDPGSSSDTPVAS